MDRISKLPEGIIETILCLLPIQEAARTSILSREWRYHWTKIPKLTFIEDMFQVSANGAELSVLEQTFDEPSERIEMTKRCKFFYAIYQVLLMHQGPIHEFTLTMRANGSCVEIDHVLLHLARRNTIKKLKLELRGWYKLPLSFFSLHQLTELHLKYCYLGRDLPFSGFGSLTVLYLQEVIIDQDMLFPFLSGCPLLKRLTLNYGDTFSGVTDLLKCLPAIEYLSIWCFINSCYCALPNEHPSALVHLKYLRMEYVCICHYGTLAFFRFFTRSFPNLEKLTLVLDPTWYEDRARYPSMLKEYLDIKLERLKELEIRDFSNDNDELDFVRLVLAKSPVLKTVTIFLYEVFAKDEESEILNILSHSLCASPGVKIFVRWFNSNC